MKIKKFAALMLALALAVGSALPALAVVDPWTYAGYEGKGSLYCSSTYISASMSIELVDTNVPHLPEYDASCKVNGSATYVSSDGTFNIKTLYGIGNLSCSAVVSSSSATPFRFATCDYYINGSKVGSIHKDV